MRNLCIVDKVTWLPWCCW